MTLAEAEAILGGPPRDESTGTILLDAVALDDAIPRRIEGPRRGTGKPDGSIHRWASDAANIRIIGNTAGGVWAIDWVPVRLEPAGVLDTLRRWLLAPYPLTVAADRFGPAKIVSQAA